MQPFSSMTSGSRGLPPFLLIACPISINQIPMFPPSSTKSGRASGLGSIWKQRGVKDRNRVALRQTCLCLAMTFHVEERHDFLAKGALWAGQPAACFASRASAASLLFC